MLPSASREHRLQVLASKVACAFHSLVMLSCVPAQHRNPIHRHVLSRCGPALLRSLLSPTARACPPHATPPFPTPATGPQHQRLRVRGRYRSLVTGCAQIFYKSGDGEKSLWCWELRGRGSRPGVGLIVAPLPPTMEGEWRFGGRPGGVWGTRAEDAC